LATLVRFWHSQGEKPKSNSELIRLSIEAFAEFLILNGKIDFVQTQSDALEILENTGLKVERINPKNLAKALVAEGASIDSLSAPAIDPGHRQTTATRPISSTGPEVAAAKARMEKSLEEELKQRISDANARTQAFKDNLLNPGPVEE
jgi:hypothetical protein